MQNLDNFSKLSYLTVTEYKHRSTNIADFRTIPRPHFCMGLVLSGNAEFHFDDTSVSVNSGELIFVPVTSTYRAVWTGEPDIHYISMHFSFENYGPFSREQIINIQKIIPNDFEKMKDDFIFALKNHNNNPEDKLLSLSVFFKTLSEVFAKLDITYKKKTEKRIDRAADYIIRNYEKNITIEELAAVANMSSSYFLSRFRSEMGMTVTEFKNRIRIDHAMLLLISPAYYSVEQISSLLGFESSVYFRRVFKKITGKTPSDYRKSAVE